MAVGNLLIQLGIDTRQMTRSLRGVNRTLNQFKSVVVGVFAGRAVASVANFTGAIISSQDAVGKFALKIGESVEFLSTMGFVAKKAGLDQGAFNTAVQRANRRLAEFAATGKGEAKTALELLGPEFVKAASQGAKFSDLLPQLSDRFKALEGDNKRLLIAFKLFDVEGTQMVNLLREGGRAIERDFARGVELGAQVTEDQAAAAEKAADNILEFQTALQGFSRIFVNSFLPDITEAVEGLTNLVLALKSAADDVGRAANTGKRSARGSRKGAAERAAEREAAAFKMYGGPGTVQGPLPAPRRGRGGAAQSSAAIADREALADNPSYPPSFGGGGASVSDADQMAFASGAMNFFPELQSQIEETTRAGSAEFTAFADIAVEDLNRIREAQDEGALSFIENLKLYQSSWTEFATDAFLVFSDGMASAFSNAIVFGEDLGKSLKKHLASVAAFVIKQLIKMFIMRVALQKSGDAAQSAGAKKNIFQTVGEIYANVFNWFSKNVNPIAAAVLAPVFAGIALAGALSFFADGGIVTGPTLGVLGEAGTEAIIPLDRLHQFMGNSPTTVNVLLDGEVLTTSVLSHANGVLNLQGIGV